MKNIIILFFCSFIFSVSCLSHAEEKSLNEEQMFENWKKTQNKDDLEEYKKYMIKNLVKDFGLINLTINRHEIPEECQSSMFIIPPKNLWSEIIKPLNMLENLLQKNIIENYKIISTFRKPEENECIGGAKSSKHLHNAAVDFFVEETDDMDYQDTQIKICKFWLKNGKKLNMGVGTYEDGYFHIDFKGFRTWGPNYKSSTSACMHI